MPDTHAQCAGAARSTVLRDADVVMLLGARLNWLLSHGKGKAWGSQAKKFIQVDIEPKEMDSNIEIAQHNTAMDDLKAQQEEEERKAQEEYEAEKAKQKEWEKKGEDD